MVPGLTGHLGTNSNFCPKPGFPTSEMEEEKKAFGVGHMISMNQRAITAVRADVIPDKEFLQEKGVISATVPGTSEIPSGVCSTFQPPELRRDCFVPKQALGGAQQCNDQHKDPSSTRKLKSLAWLALRKGGQEGILRALYTAWEGVHAKERDKIL